MRTLLAILLLSAAQFGGQLFLPALPDIAYHFSLSDAATRQIIMLYFIGFGLSQLFYGPWLDAIGHRKVFLTGQGLYIVGSLLCYLANSPTLLATGRILQGLGAGAPLIISRVVLGESMSGEKLRKAFGYLAIAASFTAVLAPLFGGWLTTQFGFKGAFLMLTLYLIMVGVIAMLLLPHHRGEVKAMSLSQTLRDYGGLLANKSFLTIAMFKWIPTLMFLSSITYLPFALQSQFSLTAEQYGFYMMMPAAGLILGSSLATMVQRYCSATMVLAIFWPLLVLSGLILHYYSASLSGILFAVSLFMVASGAYYPNCLGMMMAAFKRQAGTAGALLGAVDMLGFSLLAGLVNRYLVTDIESLGTVYLCCAVLLAVNWLVYTWGSEQEVGVDQSWSEPIKADV
ncbi:MAG: DHA1 family 2-module integral membrane pump EmrD-like MFS transporter [Phenylobacterium sp.]